MNTRRGFTLVDVAGLSVAGLVGGAVLSGIPGATGTTSDFVKDLRNLHEIGQAGAGYGLDNQDAIFSLNWQPGVLPDTQWDDLALFVASLPDDASFASEAASAQQTAIVRDLTGRGTLERPQRHIPFILYNHLVLGDRVGAGLPNKRFISPADSARLEWAKNHETFVSDPPKSAPQFVQDGAVDGQWRWPYGSSYIPTHSAYSPDIGLVNGLPRTLQKPNGGGHNTYIVQDVPFGGRALTEVSFPAHKVWMHDPVARHFGPQTYHAYENATAVQLFFDGSVSANATANANLAFFPNAPTVGSPCGPQIFPTQTYTPDTNYEPVTQSGNASDVVNVHYEQTRSGLQGIDFNGDPVDISCPPERPSRKRGWWTTGLGGAGG